MSGPAQDKAETVNDYAQKIKLDQRPNTCDPEYQQKTGMNQAHSSDSKRERIAAKEMQDLIDHRHFMFLCLFSVSRSFHTVRGPLKMNLLPFNDYIFAPKIKVPMENI